MAKLLNMKHGALLDYIEERVTRAQFTDGGAAVGTYTMKHAIPVGATVLRTSVTGVSAFPGDTSAVLVVGDGTDVDRLNTGTPSVFTTATIIDLGLPSGVLPVITSYQPVLTVTSDSDFGAVDAGELTLKIYGHMVL
jgi:hypothetical protein